jgi:hypothetical protein
VSHKRRSHRQLAADQGRIPFPTEIPEVLPARSRPRADTLPSLRRIEPPRQLDQTPLDPEIDRLIAHSRARIQAFQDRWDQPQIEQFVASDFELVYRVLAWIVEQRLLTGNRMVEWGCGFAVVAALGSRLGLDVTGIEAESRLLEQARQTVQDFAAPVELVRGNFLPRGAEALSPNPEFPSLGHAVPSAYDLIASDLDDFALVFGYPWPGEWVFHERVFARYGGVGALLVLFYGPNDVRVFRKG